MSTRMISADRNLIEQLSKRAEASEADNVGLRGTLRDEILRAEAAEARAADAEIRAKSWHDSAMTLADQRDAAYKRNTELEAERDAFSAENDAVHRAINEMCGTDTSTIEAVQHVIEQRDELARKLEQAQRALKEIIDLGQDSHAAFDGERWREMWKVACMNIESWRKDQ